MTTTTKIVDEEYLDAWFPLVGPAPYSGFLIRDRSERLGGRGVQKMQMKMFSDQQALQPQYWRLACVWKEYGIKVKDYTYTDEEGGVLRIEPMLESSESKD